MMNTKNLIERMIVACRWRVRWVRLALSLVWRKTDRHPEATRISWADAWWIADLVHNPDMVWIGGSFSKPTMKKKGQGTR
jgi:hypothetical protein